MLDITPYWSKIYTFLFHTYTQSNNTIAPPPSLTCSSNHIPYCKPYRWKRGLWIFQRKFNNLLIYPLMKVEFCLIIRKDDEKNVQSSLYLRKGKGKRYQVLLPNITHFPLTFTLFLAKRYQIPAPLYILDTIWLSSYPLSHKINVLKIIEEGQLSKFKFKEGYSQVFLGKTISFWLVRHCDMEFTLVIYHCSTTKIVTKLFCYSYTQYMYNVQYTRIDNRDLSLTK